MQLYYDTVVFDLDGTLLNTLDDLADSVNFALQKHSLPQRSLDEVCAFVGNGVALLVRRAMDPIKDESLFNEVLSDFRAHYSQNMQNKTCPYEGIIPLLTTLNAKGVKMAVVSNKFQGAVTPLIKDYYGDLIPVAVGEDENTPKKPDPTGTLKAIKLLNASNEHAVFIGDSEVDMQTAKNAGLPAVGCTWGFRSREVLKNAGADIIIDSPEQLLDILTAKL